MGSSRARNMGIVISIAVAALGYFVDLYDIVIFGVVRVKSLTDLGIVGDANTTWGIHLQNLGMIGMLVGGFTWGVIGDKIGRKFALIATITTYSIANIANGFVVNIEMYAVLRFIAGFGLAGELGAGITLVSELMPKKYRGYGTTIISFLGLLGALTASLLGRFPDVTFLNGFVIKGWRMAYFIGGAMGFVVLIGRMFGLKESEIFKEHSKDAGRGNLLLLLKSKTLFKYLRATAVGVPIWFFSGILVTLSPEFGKALNLAEPVFVGTTVLYQATGLAIGSVVTGMASEWLKSRKKVVAFCFTMMLILGIILLGTMKGVSAQTFYWTLFFVGLGQGYWTVFITMAAEQFGTNIRATVTTSVPNIVRAMVVPMSLVILALKFSDTPAGRTGIMSIIDISFIVGGIVFALAYVSLFMMKETHGEDLNYKE